MKKRLYVSQKWIEVEKPSGGGHGPDAVYALQISFDGELALHLTSSSFKRPGQMAKFAEFLEAFSARDISETRP